MLVSQESNENQPTVSWQSIHNQPIGIIMRKSLALTTLTALMGLSNFALASAPSSASTAGKVGKNFDHVITVIFENTNYADVIRQPFFKELALKGANFTNFLALTHPSQGNYIALTSGSLQGVKNDKPIDLDVKNIADSLEAKGLTWKVYAESYPGNCFQGETSGTYARKHNPFISYVNIHNNPSRCANIVNSSEFDKDRQAGTLPNYVFYVPDIKNDGHDTGVAFADNWYQKRFGSLLQDAAFMNRTILVSTFDESGKHSSANQIYTTINGPSVVAGDITSPVNTLSLLKLEEDNWGLGALTTQDQTAQAIPNIWN